MPVNHATKQFKVKFTAADDGSTEDAELRFEIRTPNGKVVHAGQGVTNAQEHISQTIEDRDLTVGPNPRFLRVVDGSGNESPDVEFDVEVEPITLRAPSGWQEDEETQLRRLAERLEDCSQRKGPVAAGNSLARIKAVYPQLDIRPFRGRQAIYIDLIEILTGQRVAHGAEEYLLATIHASLGDG